MTGRKAGLNQIEGEYTRIDDKASNISQSSAEADFANALSPNNIIKHSRLRQCVTLNYNE